MIDTHGSQEGFTHFSSSLGFARFLGIVSSNTLSFQFFSLGILLLVIAKEVNFVVVVVGCGCGSGSRSESLACRTRSGKRAMFRCVRLDVNVPPCSVRVFGRIRCRADLVEYMDIGL